MTDGTVRQSKARLEPISDIKNPREIAPTRPPMQFIDPIFDTCSFVKGPVIKGVSSDVNFANAGDIHPMTRPCPFKYLYCTSKRHLMQISVETVLNE